SSTDQAFFSLFSSEAMMSFSTRGMARLSALGARVAIRLPGGRGGSEERWRGDAARPEELQRSVCGRQLI
ncbi:MAG: hypothetical protein KIT86_15970, partial [Hydrogenophaga sp.]|uniref:hypothetical protein n=1 Tax=Hydrogenophaga sp. TaxID=1904254 RepID=UPI00261C477E